MKLKKENGLPNALLQHAEPAKKRSKLVLPEPQVSDQDMQQVVKLGKASDTAKEVALESGVETTDALLGDYSITPQTLVTPRTPAVIDRIMQEAQTIMALTNVETPLKGGVNTPLHSTDFSAALPAPSIVSTPNTLLVTPYRSGDTCFHTPMNVTNKKEQVYTPALARDKLNINMEEYNETPIAKNQQSLREKLSTLPTPRNDYEIVVPEDSLEDDREGSIVPFIEDQSDADIRLIEEEQAQKESALKRRSQVIQKRLPRPVEINTTILRPPTDMVGLTELQRAEESIKQEMITMLHYDAMQNPVAQRTSIPLKKVSSLQQLQTYLEQNPYDEHDEDELSQAEDLLKKEMKVVKTGMAHGDLSLENYSHVWQECLSQVLYLPSQNRYTRANLASKKDRLEATERKLEQNRKHMAREAKRCGKIEKRLKILTSGYQVIFHFPFSLTYIFLYIYTNLIKFLLLKQARAQAIVKQLNEIWDQIDQNSLALSTFKFLATQENSAIPQRKGAITEDVYRQTEREKQLQAKFADLQLQLQRLDPANSI